MQPARAEYLQAWHAQPGRAEPLYEIARQYRLGGKCELGYLFAKRAAATPLPERRSWLVDTDVYLWQAVDELAQCAYSTGRYEEAFELMTSLLEANVLPSSEHARIRRNCESCRAWTGEQRGEYPAEVVDEVRRRLASHASRGVEVTLTITSCRRTALFERTLNSFLRCCTDIERVGRWVCVDKGTSEDERARLRERYPFIEYRYFDPVGFHHADSMNHLMETVSSPFWLHLEDDWQFIARRPYVAHGMAVLADDASIAQVAFNRNYAELHESEIAGGYIRRTSAGVRYLLHEQIEAGTPEWEHHWHAMPPPARISASWPHFTLNPSLMRTEAVRSVGQFGSVPGREFELEFARRFAAGRRRTAFFDEISCLHIGRLRYEAPGAGRLSAYDLVEAG
ncbi:MAG: hypothetical protein JOZ73_03370 [Solirubrobacterales bacterium]|nr:hypothetical protein [Solirubrobacterales bacterium]